MQRLPACQKLKEMYANENSPFSDADLNSSTKQLKNKTAGGDPAIQAIYLVGTACIINLLQIPTRVASYSE